jgi:hypothetical protein
MKSSSQYPTRKLLALRESLRVQVQRELTRIAATVEHAPVWPTESGPLKISAMTDDLSTVPNPYRRAVDLERGYGSRLDS